MRGGATKELIKFRADPVLRRAIRLRGALEDRTITDVIVEALEDHLREELAEIRRRGPAGEPAAVREPRQPNGRRRERDGS
jgi:hypothetical protein